MSNCKVYTVSVHDQRTHGFRCLTIITDGIQAALSIAKGRLNSTEVITSVDQIHDDLIIDSQAAKQDMQS